MMSVFVDTLKRLYEDKRVSKEKIDELLELKKITLEEHLYILGKDGE